MIKIMIARLVNALACKFHVKYFHVECKGLVWKKAECYPNKNVLLRKLN